MSRYLTKCLSKVLLIIVFTVKNYLNKYCDDVYSTSSLNKMWILTNYKACSDLL